MCIYWHFAFLLLHVDVSLMESNIFQWVFSSACCDHSATGSCVVPEVWGPTQVGYIERLTVSPVGGERWDGAMGTNATNWYRLERPSTTVRQLEYIRLNRTWRKCHVTCLLQLMSWSQVAYPTNPRLAAGLEHHFRTVNLVFLSSWKLSTVFWYSIIIKHVGLIKCPVSIILGHIYPILLDSVLRS